MPKGSKRIEMKNESTTIVNCDLCSYRVTKKCPLHILKKYLKLHYKSAHKKVLTDKEIDDVSKNVYQNFRAELGGIEGELIRQHQRAVLDFKLADEFIKQLNNLTCSPDM